MENIKIVITICVFSALKMGPSWALLRSGYLILMWVILIPDFLHKKSLEEICEKKRFLSKRLARNLPIFRNDKVFNICFDNFQLKIAFFLKNLLLVSYSSPMRPNDDLCRTLVLIVFVL